MQNAVTDFYPSHGSGGQRGRTLSALLVVSLWMSVLVSAPPAWSGQASSIPQMAPAPEPDAEEEGFFVHAIVRGIDLATGLVDLETEIGSFYAIATGDDLVKLQEGDEITVYIADPDAPLVRV